MFLHIRRFLSRKKTKQSSGRDEQASLFFADRSLSMSDQSLKSRRRQEWLEEALVNYSDEELAKTDKNYLGLSLSKGRVAVYLSLIFVVIGLLFGRAFFLQVVKGAEYQSISEQNRIRLYHLVAPRGIIYDVNEKPLVKNVPNFAVFISPFDFNFNEKTKHETVEWLRNNLGGDEFEVSLAGIEAIKPTKKEYFEPVVLVEGLDYEEALKLRIQSPKYAGVSIEVRAKREYLNTYQGEQVYSLSHVLGYEGKINKSEYDENSELGYLFNDNIGKIGLEKSYEHDLRGKYGREQVEVDSTGKAIKILAKEEVQKGNNVYLNIDLVMQAKLESIIESYINKIGQKRAAAVVMNPQTGAVHSLISLPSYDNNLFSKGISSVDYARLINNENNPLFNRVVSGEYPSGSTIKPVIGAAALEEGIVNEHTSFSSVGGLRIGQWFFPDWRAGGHGITNARKAIAESVNTYFYMIGGGYGERDGLGVYKIKEYAEKFGLNKKTGIDITSENTGFLPTPEWKKQEKNEPWYIGDTYHLAIGQGDLLVTPLQVANFTAVFANEGMLMQPQLIDRYFDQEKQQIMSVEPVILNEYFVKQNNLQIIRQGMRQAVTSGSARILNSLPVTAGAKTGTAQWKEGRENHSWFTAFAPYTNAELVVTVLVEEGGDGSQTAAYITNEFLNWYFRYYK
jgi:penicillin-binding protein 2